MSGVFRKIGLIVNPVAGVGGKAGLKGSDGEEIQRKALEKGIVPEAPDKAKIALGELLTLRDELCIYTYSGKMGEECARELGFDVRTLGSPCNPEKTQSTDTIQLAQRLAAEGVELILFAGGDGTARNVCEAIKDSVPVIGIPAGVKIHSGVYAVNPLGAGNAARHFLLGGGQTRDAEVMDLDEEAYRQGVINTRLYGYMSIPDNEKSMQNVKARSVSQTAALDYIATDVIQSMRDDVTYIIGAGTTTRNIMEILGLDYTLIGVDAICNGELIAKDVDERELWDIVKERQCHLIITVIGGQGHMFGRGNQQISPRIIRKLGRENITVIATKEKLLSLPDRRLLVDTGDTELDRDLDGYIRVVTGLNERTMCRVAMD